MRALGLGTVIAGMLLAVAGLAASPAAADGNNGTIKVDEQGLENGPGAPNSNDPHIDCVGRIEWYGFDEGVLSSDVVFEVQAPTTSTGAPGALTFQPYDDVPIVDGDGPGGTSLDGTLDFDLSGLLASYRPHPKQGYHVKVTAHTTFSQGSDVKHKVFWIQPCEAESIGGLTIEKAVDGNDLPAAGTEFEFTLGCESAGEAVDLNGGDAGDTATFVLTAGGSAEAFPLLPAGASCTITETDDQDADRTSWVVDDGDPSPGDSDFVVVTVSDATTVAVIATNTFSTTPSNPRFGSLSLNKDVTGDAPDEATEFSFEVECSNGVEQTVHLTAQEAAHVIGNLPTGTTCDIVETDDGDADDTIWTGGTAIQGRNGISVTIGHDTTVAVTATNDFDLGVLSLPTVVNPVVTPQAVAPTVGTSPIVSPAVVSPQVVTPQTEVAGVVLPRTLPRTGSTTLPLLQIGLGMILLGAGTALFGRGRTTLV